MAEKPLYWLGSSLDDLRGFPDAVRRAAGYELGQVQQGLLPSDWKPMMTVGAGVYENCPGSQASCRRVATSRPTAGGSMTTRIQRSSGNVFRDLGFPDDEAENLKIRTDLMVRLSKLIEARGLTQAQAARLFGVTQPRVSNLVRGKIDRFSIDTLVAMLGHAGVRVQIVVGRTSKVA